MAAETGNSYTTGTTTDSVEISTASPGLSTMVSPNKVIKTMTDNRKWQCDKQNWKYLYLWNYDR